MNIFQPFNIIYLIKNVDIDISYNHQYYFEDDEGYPETVGSKSGKQKQYEFFYSKKFKDVLPGTYQRKNSMSIQVPFLAEDLKDLKYLMWKNNLKEDGTKPSGDTRETYEGWQYAFVTSIDYINPNNSLITYQLDVYQTYLFDMEWKQSFINRQHEHRWVDKFYNIPVINTEEETLEYGDTYQILSRDKITQGYNTVFMILGCTDDVASSSFSKINGMPTQLYYYILPIYEEPGYEYYFRVDASTQIALSDASSLLNEFKTNSSLVGKLATLSIVPFLPLKDISVTVNQNPNRAYIAGTRLAYKTISGHNVLQCINTTSLGIIEENLGRIYDDYPTYDESKLLMYPYSFIELATDRGDTKLIHNEYINNGIGNIEIKIYGTLSFQNKYSVLINNYLNSSGQLLENALHDNTQTQMPIVDDNAATYLQAHSNSIRVANSNALNSYNLENENAARSLTIAQKNADTSMESATVSSFINLAGAAASGIVSIATLNVDNFGGLIQSAAGQVANMASAKINQQNALSVANIQDLSTRRSASVSYQNAVASEMAKVKDAQQIPSNVRQMGGDYLFNIAWNCDKAYVVKKTIQSYYANKLTNYFKQYGYKVNKLESPKFHTRKKWNYIRMTEPNLYGNIPMNDLMKIRDIFMNGITLWHGDYIGDYSLDNEETTFNVTVKCSEGGTLQQFGSREYVVSYPKETHQQYQFTVTALAKTGYQFVEWSDGITTANRTITVESTDTEDKLYYAIFKEV